MGGVGKSALAIRAAAMVLGNFPDGQLYLNLQGAELKAWPYPNKSGSTYSAKPEHANRQASGAGTSPPRDHWLMLGDFCP
jgi:hypothetical protein